MTMFQNDRGYVTHSCECGARAPETFDRDTAYAAATRRYGATNAIDSELRESIRFAVAFLVAEARTYLQGGDCRNRLMQHAARLTVLADLGEKAERAAQVLAVHGLGGYMFRDSSAQGAPFDEPMGGDV